MNISQKKWLELVKDCGYDIRYHPIKANVVVNALSRKVMLSQSIAYWELQQELVRDQMELVIRLIAKLRIQSTLLDEIHVAQLADEWCN